MKGVPLEARQFIGGDSFVLQGGDAATGALIDLRLVE